MNDDTIGLSRRKMLVGLGAVGVASAGAGLGTTAYFNDTETFENNSLTAGELDLSVHVDYSEDQGSYGQYSTPNGTFVDGDAVGETVEEDGIVLQEGQPLSIQVSDLKPGDSGEGEFCFSIVDNPAYMWMCGALTANDENGMTEPEMDDDETPDSGDLADAMEVTVSYCDTDGEKGDTIVSGSLRDVMLALRAGVPLSGDGDAGASLADRPVFEGVTEAFTDGEPNVAEQCVCFTWEVPTSVENEIQTDSVMFDFEFYAVQSRHNDGTHNPCVEFDTVLTTDVGPGVDRDGDEQGDTEGSWITARVSSGPTTVVQVELDGDVYGGGNSGLGEWPSNANQYVVEANFDVDTDGLGESPNDDFRFGFGSATSAARSAGIANSTSGASGDGGYIRRNIGTGGTNNRFDTAAEDVPGFLAVESGDKLTYTFVIDWTSGLPALSGVPTQFVVKEVFAGDGGEGVAAIPNSSNDGRGAIDNVTDASGVINV